MKERSMKARFLPLAINTGVTLLSFGAAGQLEKASEKLKAKNKNFLGGVVKGLSKACETIGGVSVTIGNLVTIGNACMTNEYTDEEMQKILDCEEEEN